MKKGITHKVSGAVAAAAPPASMIEGMERLGFDITHVYGLTETYGPAAVCAKHAEWETLDIGRGPSATAGKACATRRRRA
jgi:fatty-acyl-CoA synthase